MESLVERYNRLKNEIVINDLSIDVVRRQLKKEPIKQVRDANDVRLRNLMNKSLILQNQLEETTIALSQ